MGVWTTTPRTWVAGEVPTATHFNENVRDLGRAFADAWTSYTPTLKDSTNATLANWTCTGKYLRAGKFVVARFDLVAGSSPGVGTGVWRIDLPATAATLGAPNPWSMGSFLAMDASPAQYTQGRISIDGTGYCSLWYLTTNVNGAQTGVASGAPITWASGDRIVGSFTYEAA